MKDIMTKQSGRLFGIEFGSGDLLMIWLSDLLDDLAWYRERILNYFDLYINRRK
jgi:hypothetical protein